MKDMNLIYNCTIMVKRLMTERQKDIDVLKDLPFHSDNTRKDIKQLEKNIRFLYNLLLLLEAFMEGRGGSKSEHLTSTDKIQDVMNFIVEHDEISLSDLIHRFILSMSETELDQILCSLETAKFIYPPIKRGNTTYFKYNERRANDNGNT